MNNCSRCGRFFSWDSQWDCETPFGSSTDLEPPDPEYFCEVCANKELEEMLLSRRKPSHPWRPGRIHTQAAILLGYVEAGPRGAAWADFFKPDNIPEGYVVWE